MDCVMVIVAIPAMTNQTPADRRLVNAEPIGMLEHRRIDLGEANRQSNCGDQHHAGKYLEQRLATEALDYLGTPPRNKIAKTPSAMLTIANRR